MSQQIDLTAAEREELENLRSMFGVLGEIMCNLDRLFKLLRAETASGECLIAMYARDDADAAELLAHTLWELEARLPESASSLPPPLNVTGTVH